MVCLSLSVVWESPMLLQNIPCGGVWIHSFWTAEKRDSQNGGWEITRKKMNSDKNWTSLRGVFRFHLFSVYFCNGARASVIIPSFKFGLDSTIVCISTFLTPSISFTSVMTYFPGSSQSVSRQMFHSCVTEASQFGDARIKILSKWSYAGNAFGKCGKVQKEKSEPHKCLCQNVDLIVTLGCHLI